MNTLLILLSYCCGSAAWTSSVFPTTLLAATGISSTAKIERDALLSAISQVQSPQHQKKVEDLITVLAGRANADNSLKLPIKVGTAYRTVWSTITASTPIGILLRQTPAAVLGGDSWQIISKDGKKAENIVYWPLLGDKGLRMVGLADLRPLPQGETGYTLIIKGLAFRLGKKNNVPEVDGTDASDDKTFPLFVLPDGKELENGKGTLEVLYFDGVVRISRDNVQKNTYVHIREPISSKQMRDSFPRLMR